VQQNWYIFIELLRIGFKGLDMPCSVSGLCVRAGNRSTKAEFITKVQLKNCR